MGGHILWRTSSAATVGIDEQASRVNDELGRYQDRGRRDIRLRSGTSVTLLTDTEPGKIIDRSDAVRRIAEAAASLEIQAVALQLREDPPQVDAATAPEALEVAQNLMGRSLVLVYEDQQYTISRDRIGSWFFRIRHDQCAVLDGDVARRDVIMAGNVDPCRPPSRPTTGV